MRSWRVRELGAPEIALTLEELPDPEPAENEIVVKVHSAGVNFPDLLLCEGKYHHKPNVPFGLGMEAAGRVVAVGDLVDGVAIGSRVLTAPMSYGCFSELCVAPYWAVLPLDEEVTWDQAAALFMTYQTAWIGLHKRARVRSGDWVIISGASGGVGSAAIEVARGAGAKTIALVSSKEKAEFCLRRGADHVVLLSEADFVEGIKDLTDGRGADVVFDPVGGPVFKSAMRCLRVEGRYVVVGFASGESPTIGANYALMKNIDIVGFRLQPYREDAEYVKTVHDELMALLKAGSIAPVICSTYEFDETPSAVARFRNRDVMGKIVVSVI